MSGITLHAISKVFPCGTRAVQDIDLSIEDGELMVLVGPSGCGKSTILRMIAGLEVPSDGTVHIGGRDARGTRPRDRDIAMVFQNYALYPHLTVEENLGFALRMRGVSTPRRRERVAHTADLLGITPILGKKPSQLSGGERQRVALGRAITREPGVFLFDEPLSNLDPERRHSMRGELRRLQRQLRTTTVHVTHDHEEAMAMGDRIAVMRDGRLEQVGPPEEVYANPGSEFVGTFLGSPRMNTLHATLTRAHDNPAATVSLGDEEHTLRLDAARVPDSIGDGDACVIGFRPQETRLDARGALGGCS